MSGRSRAATTFTWNPAGSGTNWSVFGNWLSASGTAPSAGSSLEFGAAGSGGLVLANNGQVLTLGSITFDSNAPAYVITGGSFSMSGSMGNNSLSTETFTNNVSSSQGSSVIFDYGIGNIVYSGSLIETASGVGGTGWAFNAPLTTLSGGVTSTAATGRILIWSGTGNILLSSQYGAVAADNGNTGLTYEGSGTLTFSAGTSGTGSISGANSTGAPVQIGSGAAAITGSTGNSTLLISGNYVIGSAGAASLTIKGGIGNSTATQGTLSLADSTINTLTISSTAPAATVLTMGQSSAAPTILNMEIGNNSSDEIVLGAGLKASVGGGAGSVVLNINGLGGFTSGSATQTLTLISAPGTGLTANGVNFTLNTLNGNFGGYTTATLANSTTSALILTLGGYIAASGTEYWGGALGSGGNSTWSLLTGGTNNNSNWLTAPTGGVDAHQTPGAGTNVVFVASTGSNYTNVTLGGNTTVESLTFSGTNAPITIGGTNTLTINASGTNGNAVGNGITVAAGSGVDTINAKISLGGNQTWTINSATSAPFIVNGVISGAHAFAVSGAGELVLGGNNTFTNGLIINSGIVVLSNTGALNGSAPNAVSFGAGSTGLLDINGQSVTAGSLSTNSGTVGTPVVQDANAANGLLIDSQAINTTYAGTLRDGSGGGVLSLTKSGTGTLTLSGTNTYTGSTTVNGGNLQITGSLGPSAITVNSGGILSGVGGRVGGPVTINTGGEITAGIAGAPGTLNLGNNLTLNSNGAALFNIINGGANDLINVGGTLTFKSGAILEVPVGLYTAGTYNLFTFVGAIPIIGNVTGKDFNGSQIIALSSNYSFVVTGGGGLNSGTVSWWSQLPPRPFRPSRSPLPPGPA